MNGLGQRVQGHSVFERYAEQVGQHIGGQEPCHPLGQIALAAIDHAVDDRLRQLPDSRSQGPGGAG